MRISYSHYILFPATYLPVFNLIYQISPDLLKPKITTNFPVQEHTLSLIKITYMTLYFFSILNHIYAAK
jgi:hypothetical protein